MDTVNITWLRNLEQLIIDNLDDAKLNNTWLAQQTLVSERAFYTKVRNLTGNSPNRYIRRLRLIRAYKLLLTNEVNSVREVASIVGFKKIEYFSNLFYKEFKLYPSQILNKKANKTNLQK